MLLIYRPYESTNIGQQVPGVLLYRNLFVGRDQLPSSQKTTQEQSNSILCFVWIKTILYQFFLLVVDSVFSVVYFNSFLLPVLKGWQNGLQCIMKDALDYGKEKVISCL